MRAAAITAAATVGSLAIWSHRWFCPGHLHGILRVAVQENEEVADPGPLDQIPGEGPDLQRIEGLPRRGVEG